MKIPPSFREKYETSREIAEVVQRFAGTRLQVLAKENDWLADFRIKSVESCLAKLDDGACGSISEIKDLFAAMLVVPHSQDVPAAIQELSERFSVTVKARPRGKPSEFSYNDVHVYATLDGKVSPASMSAAARKFTFEVQIHTGLQYAWWRATHDQIYKSSSDLDIGWPIRRTSSQARATLELLDAIIADFDGFQAPLSPGSEPDAESGDHDALKRLSERWPERKRPDNLVRFAVAVKRLADACSLTLDELDAAAADIKMRDLIESDAVTPMQAVAVAARRLIGGGFGPLLLANDVRFLKTKELLVAEPSLAHLPVEVFCEP